MVVVCGGGAAAGVVFSGVVGCSVWGNVCAANGVVLGNPKPVTSGGTRGNIGGCLTIG